MKKLLSVVLIVVLMSSLTFFACGKDETKTDSNAGAAGATDVVAFEGDYIVDAAYVLENMGSENLLLVDARGEDVAKKGTVDGAIATAWQYLATCEDGKSGDPMWGTILDEKRLSERLSALGMSKEKEIVLFAEGKDGWGDDGRILWELVCAGYEDVKMVDGGFQALKTAGVPVVKGATKPVATEVTIDGFDFTHNINTEELSANYDSYKVIDVRADEEYEGKVLYGEAKGGHLPNAIHIKYTDLFNAQGMLKSNSEITKMVEAQGIAKTDKIVTYCTAGIRSAYMQLILEMCGFENTQNYDESYYRWAAINAVE